MAVGVAKRRGRPPAPVDPNTAGGRLRELRERAGLNQDQLAPILRIDRSMVSKYEDGRHDMGPEILKRAATQFDVTPSFILFGEEIVFAEHTAPLAGEVGAGAVLAAIERLDPERVPVPGGWPDARAFRVVADSCRPVFEPGDIVVVRGDHRAERPEFINRYCVVEVEDPDDPMQRLGYLKRVVDGIKVPGHGQLYSLESENLDDKTQAELQNRVVRSARPVVLRIMRGA